MRTYKLYLIRHGITQGNLEGRYIGKTDVPLCAEGIAEINQLLEKYEYPNVGKVYTSPLKRCIETAKLIYPALTPEKVSDISEYDFGALENKSLQELLHNRKYNEWVESGFEKAIGGAETIAEFQSRLLIGFDKIINDMMEKRISEAAVICHGGVIMHILSMCGLPREKPSTWGVGNGKGYTMLVNASLWGNNKTAEIYTALPYGTEKVNVAIGYNDIFSTAKAKAKP